MSAAIDLSFLYELSDNDSNYIYDVITLFLDIVPKGLQKLQELVDETDDLPAIHKQAHFLKSSAAIIKIRDVYEDLVRIDTLARQETKAEDIPGKKAEIKARLKNIHINFNEALPVIIQEKDKNKPAKIVKAKI